MKVQFESTLGVGRRSDIVDGAIHVLGTCGSRGLTHRAVDSFLKLPEGSSSNYFRTRHALEIAIFVRICEIDIYVLNSALAAADVSEPGIDSAMRILADAMTKFLGDEENVINQRARLEVFLRSTTWPTLFELVDNHRRAFRDALRTLLSKVDVNVSESASRALIAVGDGFVVDKFMTSKGQLPLSFEVLLDIFRAILTSENHWP